MSLEKYHKYHDSYQSGSECQPQDLKEKKKKKKTIPHPKKKKPKHLTQTSLVFLSAVAERSYRVP